MACLRDTPPVLIAHLLTQLFRARANPLDVLTGLPHRQQLLTRLEHVLPTASEAHPISLVMTDIDHFEAINDQHGHLVGDQILQELASTVSSRCPATDLIARYSGEQFAITISIGASEMQSKDEGLAELVERVSGELLTAKKSGRNQVRIGR